MLGRYEIINETSPRPTPASTNDTTVRETPVGRSKPSVSNEDPLMMNASENGSTPMPQYTAVNPAITSVTHAAGSSSNVSGAYIAWTRSRTSNGRDRGAMRSKIRRTKMKIDLVSTDDVARGNTTVRIATRSVHITSAAPMMPTSTRTPSIRQLWHSRAPTDRNSPGDGMFCGAGRDALSHAPACDPGFD